MNGVPDIWEMLPLPAFTISPNGLIQNANPAAEDLLQQSAKKLCHHPLTEVVTIEPDLRQILAKSHDNAQSVTIPKAQLGLGNSIQMAAIRVVPYRPGLLLLLIDPESPKAAHNADRAAKSAIGLAEMLAHEIKNPLTGINGAAQLLATSLSAEDQELTDLIQDETRRILGLLSRVERFGNQLPPEPKAVNVHEILDRAIKSAAVGVAQNIEIKRQYDPSLPDVFVDPDQLLQVFHNLIANAAEAMKTADSPQKEITLKTYYDGAVRGRIDDGQGALIPIQVDICDSGPGVPEHIADHLFDPFVSGRQNGTGLGLALVSKLLSDNHALISQQRDGAQTVFRVSLPRVSPQQKGQD